MRPPLTIEPDAVKDAAPRLDALPEWVASVIEYVDTAAKAGEVVSVTSRPRMYSPAEAAERLGLSRATISRRIAAGKITTTKVGNRHRIAYDELERFWESMAAEMIDFYADDIAADLDRFADGRAQGRGDRLAAE
ncbi:MAG TPA: helix-turn-helix domain-containing protein [Ilumatobacter sp.]|nr:helix-turn-helix domain-containing protein [Ilumatobacter sp.]